MSMVADAWTAEKPVLSAFAVDCLWLHVGTQFQLING